MKICVGIEKKKTSAGKEKRIICTSTANLMSKDTREETLCAIARHVDKSTMKKMDREVKYVASRSRSKRDNHRCYGLVVPTCNTSKMAPRIRVKMAADGDSAESPPRRILLQKFIFWLKLEESSRRAKTGMYSSRRALENDNMTECAGNVEKVEDFFKRGKHRVAQNCAKTRKMCTGKHGKNAYAEFDFYCMNPNHIQIKMPERRRRRRTSSSAKTVVDDDDFHSRREEVSEIVRNVTEATIGAFEDRRLAEDDTHECENLFSRDDGKHRTTVIRLFVNKNDPSDRFVGSAKVILDTARDEGLEVL